MKRASMKKGQEVIVDHLDDMWGEELPAAMEVMTNLYKSQHQIALQLSRLVLEYAKGQDYKKEDIFNLYGESMEFLERQFNQSED